ncbi:cyclin [Ophiocordyceps camponoti-floridani]|uniref:Cyclin n=1 Tax=Ophiocordyceps camponoti-floridani TaxID=2030778 RepID=A0A8H4VH56_9HYPO|nr:cyclin [Ophiocordyceps camponoti-floridani]
MASRHLSREELNKLALEHFVYQPVGRDMIAYLAEAAHNVIACDSALYPADHPHHRQQQQQQQQPQPQQQHHHHHHHQQQQHQQQQQQRHFITQLVVSSNVQVPTLMSTLVYLTRLKSKLQPMARGLRCTTHRIFLASLILAAKYLNDSSPKNKHWANYTQVTTESYTFGFNRTEVNLMEKQLLFLLDWELRIDESDLYRELDGFLDPLRLRIVERHARKMRQREEKRRLQQQQQLQQQQDPYSRHSSPTSSSSSSSSTSRASSRSRAAGSLSPPGLAYSSSSSSYASSVSSSRQHSRSTTPLASEPCKPPPCDSPVEIVVDAGSLAYDLTPEDYLQLQESSAKKRHKRGVWGRLLGGAVTVR